MRDYVAWHDEYDDPSSRLSQRLRVVIELIGTALDGSPPGRLRFVSLCAGQGHDVLAAASAHPRGADLTGRLVELDPVNATAAVARVAALGLTGIDVCQADAGTTDAYEGAVPADLIVACGIFGNVSLADIERTVRTLPSLCARDAWVVWTRHPRGPGVLSAIDRWFEASGFERHALVVDEEAWFGVGLHRFVGAPVPYERGQRLFTFLR
jgi:hypothetical protein